ncbi:MAG: hypothetical protein CMO41_05450 [Verrucomicrobiales bacterium]|nr:hypothetical protein [Verrucomicrobiales bacterium]
MITPVSWSRYAYTLAFFVLLGCIPSLLIGLTGIGNSNLSVALLAPVLAIGLYGSIRINYDLQWTYLWQTINSLSFSREEIVVEFLAPSTASKRILAVLFGINTRTIGEKMTLPTFALIGYEVIQEQIQNDLYYSLNAFFSVVDNGNEESAIEIPISPRLRKIEEINEFQEMISDYLPTENQ